MNDSPEKKFSTDWTTRIKIPALQSASLVHCRFIEPEHLLLALISNEHVWVRTLQPDKWLGHILHEVALTFPECEIAASTEPSLSARSNDVLKYAVWLAEPQTENIDPFYILLALIELEGEGTLSQETKAALAANSVIPETARIELRKRFGGMS